MTLPYEGFERSWSAGWQSWYRAVLQRADQVHFICLGYSRACFQRRNEWMVDHAALVIAAFNGQPGGTKKYAGLRHAEGRCLPESACRLPA